MKRETRKGIWIEAMSPDKEKCFRCKKFIKPYTLHHRYCFTLDGIDKDGKDMCADCVMKDTGGLFLWNENFLSSHLLQ